MKCLTTNKTFRAEKIYTNKNGVMIKNKKKKGIIYLNKFDPKIFRFYIEDPRLKNSARVIDHLDN